MAITNNETLSQVGTSTILQEELTNSGSSITNNCNIFTQVDSISTFTGWNYK